MLNLFIPYKFLSLSSNTINAQTISMDFRNFSNFTFINHQDNSIEAIGDSSGCKETVPQQLMKRSARPNFIVIVIALKF